MDIIGTCGLICSECPAFIATKNNDNDLRVKTAKQWSKIYNAEIKPEDIICDGCREQGLKFNHCKECPIRICGIKKETPNCAQCAEYSCEVLDKFVEYIPQARAKLEELRKNTK